MGGEGGFVLRFAASWSADIGPVIYIYLADIALGISLHSEFFRAKMPQASDQDEFASNLQSALGIAILAPVPIRSKSGRVGDIGFFQHDGKYRWIRNAFHAPVITLYQSD